MKNWFAIFLLLTLCNCIVYSQNKQVFKPDFNWVSLEEAKLMPLDSVTHLNLQKVKLIDGQLPVELFSFKNLEALSLRGLKLNQLPKEIVSLNQLHFLDISKNKLANFPIQICQLAQLETLVANKNPFDYLPNCIGNSTKLRYLDLWETPVVDLPESMEYLDDFIYVDFQGVNINLERQESLKSRFPKVKFDFDPPCNCFH
jgi:Leucine-rich repeat (LRR) protein